MFQLILPFQLELPFEGPRAAAHGGGSHGMLRAAKPASIRPVGRGPARPSRSDRRKQASHSLELPLGVLAAMPSEVDL